MPSIFESEKLGVSATPLKPAAKQLSVLFPNLEWNLKKARYEIDAVSYLAISIFLTVGVFILSLLLTTTPFIIALKFSETYTGILVSGIMGMLTFTYFLLVPKMRILKRGKLIDRNLEYMLRDMQIQLTAGTPLFDTFGNIAKGGYGECSKLCDEIVREVQSGRSITRVLDEFGMLSPSEYLRRALWQIVNAVKTGSNVTTALKAISNDIRQEKENRIKMYGQELNLWGLIYMMVVVIMPSMGVTLLVILSSFLGGKVINENLFWVILIGVILFQIVFISIIRGKRPTV
jgi:flagellar protein FlaJ